MLKYLQGTRVEAGRADCRSVDRRWHGLDRGDSGGGGEKSFVSGYV